MGDRATHSPGVERSTRRQPERAVPRPASPGTSRMADGDVAHVRQPAAREVLLVDSSRTKAARQRARQLAATLIRHIARRRDGIAATIVEALENSYERERRPD